MVITRCPRCAQRQLIADQVIGELIGCNRCERTFRAEPVTGSSQVRDSVLVLAALVIGVVVAWLLARGGA